MEFTVKIDADNAAFDDADLGPEVARILRKLAARVERELTRDDSDGFSVNLYDVNGNKVGSAQVFD